MKRKKFATETEPSPQQTQQITEIANSYILTKKKKKNKPQYRAISKSLNQKSNPQTKPQYKVDQTPNPIQSKPNAQSRRSQLARRRCSSLVFIVVVVAHRKSPLIANRSMLGTPSLKVFLSLFLSDSLSQSLTLSLFI